MIRRVESGMLLAAGIVELGASGYTAMPCHGAGRSTLVEGNGSRRNSQVRLEAVVPGEVAERILDYLRTEFSREHRVTACVENVEVLSEVGF